MLVIPRPIPHLDTSKENKESNLFLFHRNVLRETFSNVKCNQFYLFHRNVLRETLLYKCENCPFFITIWKLILMMVFQDEVCFRLLSRQ